MSLQDRFDKHLESKKANAGQDNLKAAERQEQTIERNAASLRLINLVIQPALEKAGRLYQTKLGARTQVSLAQDTSTGTPRHCPMLAVVAKRKFLLAFLFYPESQHIKVIQKCTSSNRFQEPSEKVLTFAETDSACLESVVDSFVEWSLSTL